MVKAIPENVKEILDMLTGPQQVTLRSYIASLRSEIKDLQEELLTKTDADPHAHYHGHEKCTADHGHEEHEHHRHGDHQGHEKEDDVHHRHDHEGHQGHHHDSDTHHDHGDHHHGNDHAKEHHHHHEHGEHHGHKHASEGEATKDEIPAWKKKALEAGASDPSAAPFGGNWTSESSVDAAQADKMQE